jgi:hypothetical protein
MLQNSKINYSDSFVCFLLANLDNKVARLLIKARRHNRYDHNIASLLVTNEYINYLTLRDDGTISFLPKGKQHKTNSEGEWSREGRQNGKPSKIIRKLFTPKALKLFKESDFEMFCVRYQSNADKLKKTFKIHSAVNIPDVYCSNREQGGGGLNNSCMNNDRSYVNFYRYVPGLQIIALYNTDDELCGRSLLWKLDDGTFLMDRVYVSTEHYYQLFLEYAEDNNFIRKVNYKSYDDKMLFTSDNGKTSFHKAYKIKFDIESGDLYPYIDTFSYGEDDFLTNNDETRYTYTYKNTDGSRDGDEDMYECAISGDRLSEDEVTYIDRGEYSDQYVADRYAVRIGRNYWYSDDDAICEVNGEYYEIESGEVTMVNDEWHLSDNCVYCEIDECYYLAEDCVELHDGTNCLRSEAYEVCNNYYHESDVCRA